MTYSLDIAKGAFSLNRASGPPRIGRSTGLGHAACALTCLFTIMTLQLSYFRHHDQILILVTTSPHI